MGGGGRGTLRVYPPRPGFDEVGSIFIFLFTHFIRGPRRRSFGVSFRAPIVHRFRPARKNAPGLSTLSAKTTNHFSGPQPFYVRHLNRVWVTRCALL